jgi:hypothetical protein
MSIFDMCSAIAWGFTSLPIPEYDKFGDGQNILGAKGNDATCVAQGFFVQLGLTSIFYNLSLSLYYLLAIVYGWKDSKLDKIRIYMHAIPLVIGFGLAFAGIPFYEGSVWGCHIPPDPFGTDAGVKNVTLFATGPIAFTILFATSMMIAVYLKVRRDTRKAQRWRRGSDEGLKLERRVFYQALCYLGGFYLTWPIVMTSTFVADRSDSKIYWLYLATFSLAGFQGFWNALTFHRPRLQQRYLERKKQRKKKIAEEKAESPSPNTAGHEPLPSQLPASSATSDTEALFVASAELTRIHGSTPYLLR